MKRHINEWPAEKTMAAADMWKKGMLVTEIADALGITKSAMIAKADRNRDLFPMRNPVDKPGITIKQIQKKDMQDRLARVSPQIGEDVSIPKSVGATYRERRERVTEEAKAMAIELQSGQTSNEYDCSRIDEALPLEQLERCHCRWPINQGGPFLFCSAEKLRGSPYCAPHYLRSLPQSSTGASK